MASKTVTRSTHNSSTYLKLRQSVIAIYESLVITVLVNCYYNLRQVLQFTTKHTNEHGGRKPTKTSVTEFCYKSFNLSLEELINIKLIPF